MHAVTIIMSFNFQFNSNFLHSISWFFLLQFPFSVLFRISDVLSANQPVEIFPCILLVSSEIPFTFVTGNFRKFKPEFFIECTAPHSRGLHICGLKGGGMVIRLFLHHASDSPQKCSTLMLRFSH